MGDPELPERSADFHAGAKAMFDWFQMLAANHWHANPKIAEQCERENQLLLEWAEDALESVSPKTLSTWKSLDQMYEAGKRDARSEAVRQEREAILAGLDEGATAYPGNDWGAGYVQAVKDIAAGVRARSEQGGEG